MSAHVLAVSCLAGADGLASTSGERFYAVANANFPALNHVAIQRQLALELFYDAPEHLVVLCERVGVKCGHDTTSAQVLHADEDLADAQAASRPRTFGQALNSTDDNVRSEAATIVAEGGDGSVSRDQQGEDIETVSGVVADELSARPDDLDHLAKNLRVCPERSVNQRFAGRI